MSKAVVVAAVVAAILIGCTSTAASTEPSLAASVRPSAAPSLDPTPSPTLKPTVEPTPTAELSPTALAVAPGEWVATEQMTEPRQYHTATLLPDGRVLVAGGVLIGKGDMAEPSGAAELFDPETSTWTATGTMTEIRYEHTATLLADGRVLVVGGGSGLIDPPPLRSAEIYDPASGTWAATASLATARMSHTATLLDDGTVLVASGWDLGPVSGPAEVYDPVAATWSQTDARVAIRQEDTASLLLDGRVLVAGGQARKADDTADVVATAELFDPERATWTATGTMSSVRQSHAATVLGDGSVLVAGGEDGSFEMLASAEVFDPDTGTWTATGSMTEARALHTATAMPDGTVLVTGQSWERRAATAEWYDPQRRIWTATPDMLSTRSSHTATLLRDGRVLVAGGNGADPISAELYVPDGWS